MFRRFAVYNIDRETNMRVEGEMLLNLSIISRIYIDARDGETKIEIIIPRGIYTFVSRVEYKFLAEVLEQI